jgi:hypothetical protein
LRVYRMAMVKKANIALDFSGKSDIGLKS